MNSSNDFRKFVVESKKSEGWLYIDLARYLGVDKTYLSKMVSGQKVLSLNRFFSILDFLGYEIDLKKKVV